MLEATRDEVIDPKLSTANRSEATQALGTEETEIPSTKETPKASTSGSGDNEKVSSAQPDDSVKPENESQQKQTSTTLSTTKDSFPGYKFKLLFTTMATEENEIPSTTQTPKASTVLEIEPISTPQQISTTLTIAEHESLTEKKHKHSSDVEIEPDPVDDEETSTTQPFSSDDSITPENESQQKQISTTLATTEEPVQFYKVKLFSTTMATEENKISSTTETPKASTAPKTEPNPGEDEETSSSQFRTTKSSVKEEAVSTPKPISTTLAIAKHENSLTESKHKSSSDVEVEPEAVDDEEFSTIRISLESIDGARKPSPTNTVDADVKSLTDVQAESILTTMLSKSAPPTEISTETFLISTIESIKTTSVMKSASTSGNSGDGTETEEYDLNEDEFNSQIIGDQETLSESR